MFAGARPLYEAGKGLALRCGEPARLTACFKQREACVDRTGVAHGRGELRLAIPKLSAKPACKRAVIEAFPDRAAGKEGGFGSRAVPASGVRGGVQERIANPKGAQKCKPGG